MDESACQNCLAALPCPLPLSPKKISDSFPFTSGYLDTEKYSRDFRLMPCAPVNSKKDTPPQDNRVKVLYAVSFVSRTLLKSSQDHMATNICRSLLVSSQAG